MSMFSFPADMNMNEMMKPMSAMTNWTKVEEMSVSPLMVYPLGAAAAATAIGFGMAGQMAGMMTGAMQAAMQGQGSALGSKPDLSWMFPVFAEDLAPEETEATPVAAKTATAPKAKSAEIVELKPAKDVSQRKPAAKAVKAKTAPAKSKPAAPAKAKSATSDEGAVAVVEKLKSDAEIAAAAASENVPAAKAAAPAGVPALEPEDFRRPAEIEKPDSPDDLKLISGVGPKLEQVLNGLGIWTFAQVANWTAEEIAWVDDYLQFKGRIDRDDWISQARALAKGGKTA